MEERNNMENLIGKFGSTQWEPPIDEEDAKWYNGGNGIQGHQGLVGKVISDDGEICHYSMILSLYLHVSPRMI